MHMVSLKILKFNVFLKCMFCNVRRVYQRFAGPQIMADFDAVLKFWGPVEADYTTYGGLVLTRSVALREPKYSIL